MRSDATTVLFGTGVYELDLKCYEQFVGLIYASETGSKRA